MVLPAPVGRAQGLAESHSAKSPGPPGPADPKPQVREIDGVQNAPAFARSLQSHQVARLPGQRSVPSVLPGCLFGVPTIGSDPGVGVAVAKQATQAKIGLVVPSKGDARQEEAAAKGHIPTGGGNCHGMLWLCSMFSWPCAGPSLARSAPPRVWSRDLAGAHPVDIGFLND